MRNIVCAEIAEYDPTKPLIAYLQPELNESNKAFLQRVINTYSSSDNAFYCSLLDSDSVEYNFTNISDLIYEQSLFNYEEKSKTNLVDKNLKTAAAVGKPKLSDVPPVALFALGAAMSDGADKYGRFNWRDTGVTSSVFYDAIARHLVDWFNGEDFTHDSKVRHLGAIMASCAILLDAEFEGILNDDRMRSNNESVVRNQQFWKATNE
jgi:hypothetical protein